MWTNQMMLHSVFNYRKWFVMLKLSKTVILWFSLFVVRRPFGGIVISGAPCLLGVDRSKDRNWAGGAMEGLDNLPGKLFDVTYDNFLNDFPHNYFLCWIRASGLAGAARRARIGVRTGTERAEPWSEIYTDIAKPGGNLGLLRRKLQTMLFEHNCSSSWRKLKV